MTLTRSNPRARQRWTLLGFLTVLLTLTVGGVVLASHGGATTIPSNYAPFTIADEQGANDVPGQVDLTQMGRDDETASTYKLFWSWDSRSAWTGTGQTGDACALFDTDNDTFINFVVCVRVENFNANPQDVRILLNNGQPAFAFSCSDKKNDRCTNPSPVAYTDDQIQAGPLGSTPLNETGNLITHTDPFFPGNPVGESHPDDSTVEIHILKNLFAGTEVLVNVCSYPSAGNGGNNNPFDCIVSPGGGFLRIVKSAGTAAPNFTFSAARGQTTLATFTAAGSATATVNPGTQTLFPLLVDPNSGPNLTVTETAIPSPWELTDVTCKVPPTTGTSTGTEVLANNQITGVSIQSGAVTECVFTDQLRTGTLIVIKTMDNDDGGTAVAGDFRYTLGDGSSATSETGTESPGQSYTRSAGTTYNVQENTVGGPAGYTPSYSTDCSGTIAAGVTKTCTITNSDDPPSLTLTKTVVNNDGGTNVARDFTLSATGSSRSFSLAAGDSATSLTGSTGAQTVTAGVQYTLSENTVTGYTASAWTCSGTGTTQGTGADANKVTIALGGSGTCAITNSDNTPTLTLTKTVVNNDGGTNVARDFTLSATGSSRSFSLAAGDSATSLTGSTGAQTVTAGVQYTLSENTVTGYTASAWTCSGTGTTQGTGADANKVTIALGGSGTCAITNSDNTPTLTLTKTVVNDNGRTNVARDFTLSATGSSRSFSLAAGDSATSLTGSTGAQTVTAGVQYTLSENTVTGYTASAWTCSGTGTTQGTGADANKVTIALGGSGTCAITNNDTKASPGGTTVQSWVLHDSIAITGIRVGAADQATADVTFRLYSDDDCGVEDLVGTRIDTTIDYVASTGSAATPTGILVTASGTYYWTVEYEGDQFNNGFTTACGAEITQILAKDAAGGGRDDFVTP